MHRRGDSPRGRIQEVLVPMETKLGAELHPELYIWLCAHLPCIQRLDLGKVVGSGKRISCKVVLSTK